MTKTFKIINVEQNNFKKHLSSLRILTNNNSILLKSIILERENKQEFFFQNGMSNMCSKLILPDQLFWVVLLNMEQMCFFKSNC